MADGASMWPSGAVIRNSVSAMWQMRDREPETIIRSGRFLPNQFDLDPIAILFELTSMMAHHASGPYWVHMAHICLYDHVPCHGSMWLT